MNILKDNLGLKALNEQIYKYNNDTMHQMNEFTCFGINQMSAIESYINVNIIRFLAIIMLLIPLLFIMIGIPILTIYIILILYRKILATFLKIKTD